MNTTIMNNNDNTNPGNVVILLKGNNAGEMAMMGVHTILCASTNTYINNTRSTSTSTSTSCTS